MSGKKQRDVHNHKRRREEGPHEETLRATANIPESLYRELEAEANATGHSISEIMRDRLGAERTKMTPGRAPKTESEETTYNRIAFAAIAPSDIPSLPIDTRNLWGQRQVFLCLGGRFKRGGQIFRHDPRGSGYLMLFDEPGNNQCIYHFPVLDKPGQEHQRAVRRFEEITRLFIPLTEPEQRRHPDRKEWLALKRDLYNLDKPSVTTLLVKTIWQEYCYSVLRSLGHATPQSMVMRGQYDEMFDKYPNIWRAPGSATAVLVGKDILPIEILRRQLQNAC